MSKRGCGSPEHLIHRRLFLEGTMAGASASAASFSGLFSIPAFAKNTQRAAKKCILLWLCGRQVNLKHGTPSPAWKRADPLGLFLHHYPVFISVH